MNKKEIRKKKYALNKFQKQAKSASQKADRIVRLEKMIRAGKKLLARYGYENRVTQTVSEQRPDVSG